jgi:uncharacterized protein YdhG (YjbR/CyaY superfamily)
MQSKAATVEQYIAELPEDRKHAVTELRKVIKKNLPKGFKEGMSYGMIGYHCNPEQPLPFAGLASQKKFIAFYHMCVYGDPKLSKWFVDEYAKLNIGKLDMGKSCIRFKNMSQIPYQLIGELCAKVTVQQWIERYEKAFAGSK